MKVVSKTKKFEVIHEMTKTGYTVTILCDIAILAAIAMGAMLFVKPGQQTKSESLFNWRNKGELEEPRANI
ncbi:hypothetical protein EXW51_29875 (plasmid) [Bacillus mycoides]|nr:hypothetical protein [Bacillus mycoides]QWH32042.1 hypothetical protein EXW51_29875 [Bacillus mycoides]